MQQELEKAFVEFQQELTEQSALSGVETDDLLFEAFEQIASENGDCIDLQRAAARREGQRGYKLDGFAIDLERAALHLAICDVRTSATLETLRTADIERLKKRVSDFIELCRSGRFENELIGDSVALYAARDIAGCLAAIRRIRVVIFSNARLSTKRPPEADGEISGIPVVYNVLDFARFAGLQKAEAGGEPIEIDLAHLSDEPLVCLPASAAQGLYRSYLVAMPAKTLADIYGLYGARLLEQNVRTFLQAKTKVNKGIIQTIRDTPEMFFAYNNGLTATAADVLTDTLPDGRVVIRSLSGLQIVNGGQTTASILYARDKGGANLNDVFVQVKLTVVAPHRLEEVVPKISRFANTQNRISEADFFSSHPFHVAMEQLSRRLTAPPSPGRVSGSKWFYERARGQYREGAAGSTAARNRFIAEFPKSQLFDKTDLAKFELTFEARPHTVCLGAQKCFMAFADKVAREWEASSLGFNEVWFRNAVARAIIFRWTDQMVAKSQWYRDDRGFKSQTVAYTLAWIVERAKRLLGRQLDLSLIWGQQDVPEELKAVIEHVAQRVGLALRDTPDAVRNVGEYAKHQACWATISRMDFDVELPDTVLIDPEEVAVVRRDAVQTRRIDVEIEFDAMVLRLGPQAADLITMARRERLLTPRSDAALRRLAAGDVLLPPGEKTALRQLFDRLSEAGVELPRAEPDVTPPRQIRLTSTDTRQVRT
jgi:hypothetical protein